MTAQAGDKLIYLGNEYTMYSEPLEAYFSGVNKRPNFILQNTSVSRGYIGKWEIVDDLLFLRELNGSLEDGRVATLETIFPKSTDWVFAGWYSGNLRLPQGRLLEYAPRGYSNRFEREFILSVKDGVLVDKYSVECEV